MLANDVLHTVGNTPHIRINRLFGNGPQRLHQERARQSRRLDQGPDRGGDGRSGRGGRGTQAGRDDRRADVGQHGGRPGDGRRGEGLQAGPRHARQHERRAASPDAGVRRDLRADASREGHERLDREGAGDRRRDAGRLDAAAVRQPGQHRRARANDRRGDRCRLPERRRCADHRASAPAATSPAARRC